MTVEEKAKLIICDIKQESGINPTTMFKNIAKNEYINIHGPKHHIMVGACLLVAYKNAGGNIDLDAALEKLMQEGLRMSGAMGGLWCVC